MARTRGSSHRFHQDDGEIFGKGGVPIPVWDGKVPLDRQGAPMSPAVQTMEAPRALSGSTVLRGPGAEPVIQPGAIIGYRADRKSFGRNMDAWDLAMLLDMAFANPGMLGDGFVVEVSLEQFQTLNGDMRRHFLPIRAPLVEVDEETDE